MSTITPEQSQRIASLLANMTLPKGLGTRESACSIAAINLALTGELKDGIPPCMSDVIGQWIIGVQDAMPSEMRNSSEWKRLLPLAAGTGRDREQERLAIVMEWMWADVLPVVQPIADAHGFGDEWRVMLYERTAKSADATKAASATAATAARAAARVAKVAAAVKAATAARAVTYITNAAAWVVTATTAATAARAAACVAEAVARVAKAVTATTAVACVAEAVADWQQFNPCGLLQRLIDA